MNRSLGNTALGAILEGNGYISSPIQKKLKEKNLPKFL